MQTFNKYPAKDTNLQLIAFIKYHQISKAKYQKISNFKFKVNLKALKDFIYFIVKKFT